MSCDDVYLQCTLISAHSTLVELAVLQCTRIRSPSGIMYTVGCVHVCVCVRVCVRASACVCVCLWGGWGWGGWCIQEFSHATATQSFSRFSNVLYEEACGG